MKRKNKKIEPTLIIIVLILILILASYVGVKIFIDKDNNQEQTIKDQIEKEPRELQEVQYSMHKGNTFVKIGDIIGYIDKLNNSTQIINIKEGTTIKADTPKRGLEKLYFDGENMYGVPNHYSGKGIYKIDLQGNVTKIYEGECVQLWLTEDKIYFVKQNGFDEINQTPQGDLCFMDKDGKNITTVIKNVKNYFKIQNNNIYYIDLSTRALYKADINGENKEKLAEGRIFISDVTEDFLTYIDFADGEAYHVVYLEDNTNHKIGKFGNDIIIGKDGYVYTRKLKNNNNELDNESTIFKIDAKNKEEIELWKDEKIGLSRLAYVDNNIAYLMEDGVQKVDLKYEEPKREDTDIGYGFFLDGYVYEFKRDNNKLSELVIINLENNDKQNIGITYKESSQSDNSNSSTSNENNTTITQQKTII